MAVTKQDMIDKIDAVGRELEVMLSEDELTYAPRYGINDKMEIGEYAFPWMEDYEFEDFLENIKYRAKDEYDYDGEIEFVVRSSKSGTEVYMDKFDSEQGDFGDIQFNLEHGYDFFNMAPEELTYRELKEVLLEVRQIRREIKPLKKVYDKQLEGLRKIMSEVALGERTGCFSNGEVIFTPTEAYKDAKADFTPYYNPNEESA